MRFKITIGLAALALGTAFASVPALAAEQNAAPSYGRNVNDGGPGPVQPATWLSLIGPSRRVISARCGIWSLSGHCGHGPTCCWLTRSRLT